MYSTENKPIRIYSHLYDDLFKNIDKIKKDEYIFSVMKKWNNKTYFNYFHCNINEFVNIWDNYPDKNFFAVLLQPIRMFYLDCDLKVYNNEIYVQKVKELFAKAIIFALIKHFDNISINDVFIWDGSRKRQDYFKVSFHIVVPKLTFHLHTIKQHCYYIKHYLKMIHINYAKSIDMQVYHHLQNWRLPYCTNLDPNSSFSPYWLPSKLLFIQQIKLNFLSDKKIHVSKLINQYLSYRKQNNTNAQYIPKISSSSLKTFYTYKTMCKQYFILSNFEKQLKYSKWWKFIPKHKNENLVHIFKIWRLKCFCRNIYCKSRAQCIHWKFGHLQWLQLICCNKCTKYYYFRINKDLMYPWLYKFIWKYLTTSEIQSLDKVIHNLLENNQIINKSYSKVPYSWFNTKTITTHISKTIKFSVFCNQYIICTSCNIQPPSLHMKIRTPLHSNYIINTVIFYCRHCKQILN